MIFDKEYPCRYIYNGHLDLTDIIMNEMKLPKGVNIDVIEIEVVDSRDLKSHE